MHSEQLNSRIDRLSPLLVTGAAFARINEWLNSRTEGIHIHETVSRHNAYFDYNSGYTTGYGANGTAR